MSYINPTRIVVIRREKLAGPGWHFGVLFSGGMVADHGVTGVRWAPLHIFASGKDVEEVRVVPATEHSNVVARLQKALSSSQPYDILTWNCETFSTWLAGEEPRSDQLRQLALTGLIGGAAYLALRR